MGTENQGRYNAKDIEAWIELFGIGALLPMKCGDVWIMQQIALNKEEIVTIKSSNLPPLKYNIRIEKLSPEAINLLIRELAINFPGSESQIADFASEVSALSIPDTKTKAE